MFYKLFALDLDEGTSSAWWSRSPGPNVDVRLIFRINSPEKRSYSSFIVIYIEWNIFNNSVVFKHIQFNISKMAVKQFNVCMIPLVNFLWICTALITVSAFKRRSSGEKLSWKVRKNVLASKNEQNARNKISRKKLLWVFLKNFRDVCSRGLVGVMFVYNIVCIYCIYSLSWIKESKFLDAKA